MTLEAALAQLGIHSLDGLVTSLARVATCAHIWTHKERVQEVWAHEGLVLVCLQ